MKFLRVLSVAIALNLSSLVNPANAVDTPTVTAPSQPTFALNTSGQEPGDFVISGFSSSATLNVSVGFVSPPSGVTFSLPSVSGLTAGYGYDFVGGKTQISFTGTMANANTALAAMTVATGSNSGNITIRVTVYENQSNLYYNPINGHYYKYVSRANTFANSATSSQSAIHLAEATELFGVKGYLATVTTAQEQQFIYSYVSGNNIWIGASDDKELLNSRASQSFANQTAAEGMWYWVAGPEAGVKFWEGASSSGLWINSTSSATQARTSGNIASSRYENWCTGNTSPYDLLASRSMSEPNNASGEHYILEKWSGSTCWNDYGTKDGSSQSAYLVEFSENWGTGSAGSWDETRGAFSSTVSNPIATASISALADNAPRSVAAVAGAENAAISWQAPSSGTVTSYTVTSTPGSLTCTTSSLTCSISGLTAGTSYTFIVTATFNDSTTKDSLASSAVVPTAASSGSSGSSGTISDTVSTPTPSPTPTPSRTYVAPIKKTLTTPINTGTTTKTATNPTSIIGGVPTTTTTRVIDQTKLNILVGQLTLEVQVPKTQGGVSKTNTGGTQLDVKKGSSATLNGSGVLPLSTVQVFLPLDGTNSKQIATIPATSAGTFNGEALFASQIKDSPLPIGKQVLQIVSQDPSGKQAVVEMTVNIAQPAPAPEQNRQAGILPDLNPGQSIATQAGLPVPVTIKAVEQDRQAIVQGDGWTMSIKVPSSNGNVQDTGNSALLKFVQNKSVFVSGTGFLPGTRADIWIFSDPTLLGTVDIDENGNFSGQIQVGHTFVPVGDHTLQVQGVGDDGFVRAANLGVLVEADPNPSSGTSNLNWLVGIAGLIFIAAWIFWFVLRRRTKEQD